MHPVFNTPFPLQMAVLIFTILAIVLFVSSWLASQHAPLADGQSQARGDPGLSWLLAACGLACVILAVGGAHLMWVIR